MSKWINVIDNLPKNNQTINFIYKDCDENIIVSSGVYDSETGRVWFLDFWRNKVWSTVSYWLPLPAFPLECEKC